MIDDRPIRADFKEKVSPHLDVLLQFSFWLTKNGRDATRLMREALAEAFRTWNEFSSEESYVRVHNILTNHFLSGNLQSSKSPIRPPYIEDAGSIKLPRPSGMFDLEQHLWYSGRSKATVSYFEAFAGLPPMLRSTMILSYLEGFSNTEISDLSGVEPRIVDTTLSRGREFMREELFSHLMGEHETRIDILPEALTG